MKGYVAPSLVKVVINPKEAYNAAYSNCVLGETRLVELNTNCSEIYTPWVNSSDYQCYMTAPPVS